MLSRRLQAELDAHLPQQHVHEVRRHGLMCGIVLQHDRPEVERVGHRVAMKCREHGVIIRPLGDVVVLMPALSMSADELTLLVQAVAASIREILTPGP